MQLTCLSRRYSRVDGDQGPTPRRWRASCACVLGQLIRRLRAEHRFPLSQGTVLGRLDREGVAAASATSPSPSGCARSRWRRPSRDLEGDGLVERRPRPRRRPPRPGQPHRGRADASWQPTAAAARAGWSRRSKSCPPRTGRRSSARSSCCASSPTPRSDAELSGRWSRSRRRRGRSRRAPPPRPASASAIGTSTSWAMRSPGLDPEGLGRVVVEQQHPQLAAVAGVDQAGAVDQGDPVLAGQARARQDQPGVPVGDLDRDPGADAPALAGADMGGLAGVEVEPGVALVGAGGQHRLVLQLGDRKLHGAAA